jgi:hypothetical protein
MLSKKLTIHQSCNELNHQGRPKGKAAQARALDPPKILFFNEEFRPQKNSMNFLYIYVGPNLITITRVVEMVAR